MGNCTVHSLGFTLDRQATWLHHRGLDASNGIK